MFLHTNRSFLIALLVFVMGCGVTVPAVPSLVAPGEHDVFVAGASEVDVTPPPGLGTWGHGPDARPSRGHRGRLRCRVIYLEDPRGENVALVPCDFAAMDLHLQRAVAARVAPRVGLGADRIVMSATHTHGGPGHYFAEFNYSGHFSGQTHGYDPRFVRWLADRIADAILRAHDEARPARIAWFSGEVNRGDGTEPAIGQNRSLPAHCANTHPMQGAPSTCGSAAADPSLEVDGRLDLLRVDVEEGGAFRPLALYATFPVHGTAVPNTNVHFEADLWGFAAAHVVARLGEGRRFVAALANGAEGDVRPSYAEQGWDEARRLGTMLGERIVAAHASITSFEETPRITIAYRDLELSRASNPTGDEHLCRSGRLGRSAPGGSEEGRTDRYGRRWHEGMTGPERGCHRPAGRFFAHRLASLGFPDYAPLQLVGVGSGTLVSHPWEITTTAGRRLRARVEAALGGEGPVALVGLANQYLQYLTTAEEYARQHYEGASTLYGPDSLAVVTGHFEQLAGFLRASREGAATHVEMRRFRTSSPVPRRVFDEDARPLPPRVDGDVQGPTEFEGHAALEVHFVAGSSASLRTDGAVIARVERRDASGSWVQAIDAHGRPLDDTHEDLLFEHLERGRRVGREHVSVPYEPESETSPRRYHDLYRVVWVPDVGTQAGEYRFVVLGAGVERPGPIVHFPGRP